MEQTRNGEPEKKFVGIAALERSGIVSRSKAYRMVKRGSLPHYRIGRAVRFNLGEVLNALRRPASST